VVVPADGFYVIQANPAAGFDLALYGTVIGAEYEYLSSYGSGPGVVESVSIDNMGQASPVTAYVWVTGTPSSQSGAYTLRGFET
jgi:hypothetical protein